MNFAPRIRRLSAVFIVLAFLLPALPAAAGSPARGCFGFRAGLDQCMALSLGLLVVATFGIASTQSILPLSARRWTLPKAILIGLFYFVASSILPQTF